MDASTAVSTAVPPEATRSPRFPPAGPARAAGPDSATHPALRPIASSGDGPALSTEPGPTTHPALRPSTSPGDAPAARAASRLARLAGDPRHFQIAVLGSLLAWGVTGLDLEVAPVTAAAILGAALGTQWVGSRLAGVRFDPKSPLISALSLCLLLRTGSPALAAAAGALAVGSKFLIRRRGKHVFNPSNFAIVALLAVSDRAWVSPGQWGSAALAAFALACAGSVVVRRAARSDVTWAFLGWWLAVVFGRAAWLGDPWAIPLHQLASGSLLIFAFFMISDPKTTPDSRAGRVLFAALVAAGGAWVSWGLWAPNGLLWALAAAAPLVPLIDRLLPGERYRWGTAGHTAPRPTVSPLLQPPGRLRPAAPAATLGVAAGRRSASPQPRTVLIAERRPS